MTEDFRLSATPRELLGTANTRRLRNAGQVPGNLYGFRKESVNLTMSAEDVEKMVTNGSRVVDVEIGGTVEKAEIMELQWDVFSTHVKHVDMKRVDPENIVSTDVTLEIQGEPLGIKDGGIPRQLMKRVNVTGPDFRIPRRLPVRVGALQLGQSVTVADIAAPDSVKINDEASAVVFECFDPKAAAE